MGKRNSKTGNTPKANKFNKSKKNKKNDDANEDEEKVEPPPQQQKASTVPNKSNETKTTSKSDKKKEQTVTKKNTKDLFADEYIDEDMEIETKPTKKNKAQKKKLSIAKKQKDDSSDVEMKDNSDSSSDDEQSIKSSSSTQSSTPPNPKKKAKQLLLSSDDEDDNDDDELVNSSDDEDDELLPIEQDNKDLNEQNIQEEQEAAEEYQHIIKTQTEDTFVLPTLEEIQEEVDGTRILSPRDYYQRIESVLQVLSNFSAHKGKTTSSRTDFMNQYQHDLMQYFGYIPDLISLFVNMFGPNETLEFLQASEKPRPIVLRTNTLKVRRKDLASALMKRGISLDPLASWSKVGLKVYESGNVPIAATPEYLSGYYMLQGASSMCPVLALDVQVNDVVLDMCASPGGKTTYLSQVLKNTGIVHANDASRDRQKATIGNLHRLGCHNVAVTSMDGRKIAKSKPNYYDRVLLDAPCSGLGIISHDPSVKLQRTLADIQKRAHLQKELLLSAVDSTKINGTIVYSTCSIAIQENEEVVQYILQKRPNVKLVPAGLDFGKKGFTRFQALRFHSSLQLTRRFYPHVHNMDGFYVAKIVKTAATPEPILKEKNEKEEKVKHVEKVVKPKEEEKAEPKSRKVSKKPVKVVAAAKKKKSTSAKVTKPRRMKE